MLKKIANNFYIDVDDILALESHPDSTTAYLHLRTNNKIFQMRIFDQDYLNLTKFLDDYLGVSSETNPIHDFLEKC